MFYFLLMSCLSAVIGSSFYNWWETTQIGCWFNRKLDALMNWASQRLHLKNLGRAENITARIQQVQSQLTQLELRIAELESQTVVQKSRKRPGKSV
jgi:hypothetical protein